MILHYDSPIGDLIISYNGTLNGLWTPDNMTAALAAEASAAPSSTGSNTINSEPITAWLDAYFAGHNPEVTFPIDADGTDFQKATWEALREIPYGETRTYGELAELVGDKLGRPTSARAVGGALGKNPVSIVVPCHRVVGADGSLTGYAGGLKRKRFLLTLEGADVAKGSSPGGSQQADPGFNAAVLKDPPQD